MGHRVLLSTGLQVEDMDLSICSSSKQEASFSKVGYLELGYSDTLFFFFLPYLVSFCYTKGGVIVPCYFLLPLTYIKL